ncbi:agmatine deiminase family protein [Undibacterium arcticum]|uniref:Agmatine deiminase family protein n=1 Tax=Undibacterium arcticum TaxID=1762892 RepID=A0ABV7F7A1_9BURK
MKKEEQAFRSADDQLFSTAAEAQAHDAAPLSHQSNQSAHEPAMMSRRRFGVGAAMAAALTTFPFLAGRSNEAAAATDVYHAPAEWERHSGTLMAFPWDATDAWGGKLKDVQAEVAAVAKAIARYEPVTMVAMTGRSADAIQQCGPTVTVIEYPINDCWTRDNGPIFALNQTGKKRLGLDFQFNGWGNKYPYDKDDFLPVGVCAYLNVPRVDVNMVLEGGSVITDGQGTLIGTEECLLNPNRNPTMTKSQIENTLLAAYGATKFIWLPYGLEFDNITNGHIDLVASYVAPAKLLIFTAPGTGTGNETRMAANKAVLQQSTDARGRSFELVEIHQQPHFTITGYEVKTFSYTNYYRTNGGIVVPIANVPEDAAALATISALYPGLEVVGVTARTLAWGGGGVHCITQHIPALW